MRISSRENIIDRHPVISAFVLFLVGILPAGPASAAQAATSAAASPVATGDFSGLVDIGRRKLYLECRGQGSPTVILEAGAYGRADVWSRDNLHPAGARTMVLPGVAAFTRVGRASISSNFAVCLTALENASLLR